MGDKLQPKEKFDSARNVNDLKRAIEQVLLEEWPITRQRAILFSHEQRDETFSTYLQDLRFSRIMKIKEILGLESKSCKSKQIAWANCGHTRIQVQLDEMLAQLFCNGIKTKNMKQTIISKLNSS